MNNRPSSQKSIVLIHGGAGSHRPTPPQIEGLRQALQEGYALSQATQPALAIVEHMIGVLEASGLFNAGLGSFPQLDGKQRMDASIMEGQQLMAGGVASLEGYVHPIQAARLVMTKTDHVLVVGRHAKHLAQHFSLQRIPRATPSTQIRSPAPKHALIKSRSFSLYKKMGQYETVGAVALDLQGNLAAGASTGGVPVMFPGRVGDTPLIGSGVYADNSSGAISMTGLGESIIRMGMAKWLAVLLKAGYSPSRAARQALGELVSRIHGEAGCLILKSNGKFTIQHTTPWMAAGYWNGKGPPIVRDRFSARHSFRQPNS
ncbi:MAG TPA: isoaspartyl peptidase/L-asparaginase family protein [Nitrospirales bacterium]|nr:isoaspartyl peptidase/L-asparaginase family protein [Nitrospirales bacterium]